MDFSNLTEENINQAIQFIEKNKVPPGYKSKTADLVVDGKPYPPKYVLVVAQKMADGSVIDVKDFHTKDAVSFLQEKGYNIVKREKESEMSDEEKFKHLLEYFVAHLEYMQSNITDSVGYKMYIEPIKDHFTKTGNGGGKDWGLQKQIEKWELYSNGRRITITILGHMGKKRYANTTSYLNWEDTWLNVRAKWDDSDKHVVGIYLTNTPTPNPKRVGEEFSLKDLCLYDGKAPNKKIEQLFTIFEKLIGEKNMNENVKKISKLLLNKHNIILQGAPGTGKTYKTAEIALSIIGKLPTRDASEDEKSFHKRIMDAYDAQIIKLNRDCSFANSDAQIGFVTFHQSMDYEDFVEGIKPKTNNGQVTYDIENGIFKSICKKAMPKFNDAVDNFEDVWEKLIAELDEKEKISIPLLKGTSTFDIELNEYGDGLATRTYLDGKEDWERGRSKFFSKDQLYRVYQNLPGIPSGGHDNYRKAIIKKLKKDYGLLEFKKGTQEGYSLKNYVLIIDEINRGNVSKIFGELISLLEADKRIGGDHPLSVTLPYSKETFSVPSNLYIIGTMNTTDRSVGSIDYAVRRRFAFVTLEADENKVPEGNARNLFNAVKNFLNKSKYDMDIEDLMVGHSYFMDATNLQMKWQYEILPLLMEYHKDGIISKSPLKNDSGNEIADVKKDYAKFVEAWQKKESDSPNS